MAICQRWECFKDYRLHVHLNECFLKSNITKIRVRPNPNLQKIEPVDDEGNLVYNYILRLHVIIILSSVINFNF